MIGFAVGEHRDRRCVVMECATVLVGFEHEPGIVASLAVDAKVRRFRPDDVADITA